jgi:hypothetical protein
MIRHAFVAAVLVGLAACTPSSTPEVVAEGCVPGGPDYVAYVDGDSGLSAEWVRLSGGKTFANKAEYGKWHTENFANEGRVVPVCAAADAAPPAEPVKVE